MPRTKNRSSSSAAVSRAAIDQASSALQKLPEKPKASWSLREAVSLLYEAITTALSRGYSHEEVAQILAGKGVETTASSLKRYLAAVKREKGETNKKSRRPRQPRASKAAATEEVTTAPTAAQTNGNGAGSAAPAKQAAPAKGRGKTSSKRTTDTSASSQSDDTKTAAKTRSKASKTTTPRTTSTRSRKKSGAS